MSYLEEFYPFFQIVCASYLLSIIYVLGDYYYENSANTPPTISRSGKYHPAGKYLRLLARKYRFNAYFFGKKSLKFWEADLFYCRETRSVYLLGDHYQIHKTYRIFGIFHELGHLLCSGSIWNLIQDESREYFYDRDKKLFYPFFIITGFLGTPLVPMSIFLIAISVPFFLVLIDELAASTIGTIVMSRYCNLSIKQFIAVIIRAGYAFSTYIHGINLVYRNGFIMYTAIIIFKQTT